jgi:Mrp family chromosome partitioning ATPase
MPERDDTESTTDLAMEDALQAICVDARVIAAEDSCKVVMIASAREEDGASEFTNALYEFLRLNGYRVLCIDPRRAHKDENAHTLKRVLNDSEASTALISADRREKGALVCLGSDDEANILLSVRSMKRFLTSARKDYDVVLINAPPVLTVPRAALLGHVSDLCLHIVPWKKTPRRVIMSSLSRLKNALVPISGTILTAVSLEEYRHYSKADNDHVKHGGYFDERLHVVNGVE